MKYRRTLAEYECSICGKVSTFPVSKTPIVCPDCGVQMSKVLIHVGLPKTGTTFLQLEVFPKIEKQGVKVISDEGLSGDYFQKNSYSIVYNRYDVIKKLKELYPDAYINIGIREIEPWLKSLYSQYIKEGGFYKYKKWLREVLNPECLDTQSYLKFIQQHFDKVFIYKFDNFIKNKKSIIDNLCDFLEIEHIKFKDKRYNTKWCKESIRLSRFLNRNGWLFKRRNWFDCLNKRRYKT